MIFPMVVTNHAQWNLTVPKQNEHHQWSFVTIKCVICLFSIKQRSDITSKDLARGTYCSLGGQVQVQLRPVFLFFFCCCCSWCSLLLSEFARIVYLWTEKKDPKINFSSKQRLCITHELFNLTQLSWLFLPFFRRQSQKCRKMQIGKKLISTANELISLRQQLFVNLQCWLEEPRNAKTFYLPSAGFKFSKFLQTTDRFFGDFISGTVAKTD